MFSTLSEIETTGENHLIDEICQMSYIILNDKFERLNSKNFFFKVDYVHFKSKKRIRLYTYHNKAYSLIHLVFI